MCGIVGIVGTEAVNTQIYDALTILQHRGQDAAGIATSIEQRVCLRKGNGLVRDVFSPRDMRDLQGSLGIGHVRYPTAGTPSFHEAQPMYVNSPWGIALAHNGNLTNAEHLKQELLRVQRRHLNTDSDSEILLNVFAHELSEQAFEDLDEHHVFAAIEGVNRRCEGAFSVVALVPNFGLVAFRDRNGIRPLVLGQRQTSSGIEYMVASESVALDVLGFGLIGDVKPGEAIVVREGGTKLSRKVCADVCVSHPCIFEYVYFARPDSIMEGISVYKARLRMGDFLARKILHERPEHGIDVVIPVPDTSRTAAIQVAYHLGVKLREGFIKNRYIGRTFIMPGQANRKRSVRQKLNPISLEFQNKTVLIVDDSIVRGTTSKEIIRMAREAGARTVYFASAAPPIRFPNVYGIDMPAASELIAYGRSEVEVGEEIEADWLIYQSLEDLVLAGKDGNPGIEVYEDSVFTGKYIEGHLGEEYLRELEVTRGDRAQSERLDNEEKSF